MLICFCVLFETGAALIWWIPLKRIRSVSLSKRHGGNFYSLKQVFPFCKTLLNFPEFFIRAIQRFDILSPLLSLMGAPSPALAVALQQQALAPLTARQLAIVKLNRPEFMTMFLAFPRMHCQSVTPSSICCPWPKMKTYKKKKLKGDSGEGDARVCDLSIGCPREDMKVLVWLPWEPAPGSRLNH